MRFLKDSIVETSVCKIMDCFVISFLAITQQLDSAITKLFIEAYKEIQFMRGENPYMQQQILSHLFALPLVI